MVLINPLFPSFFFNKSYKHNIGSSTHKRSKRNLPLILTRMWEIQKFRFIDKSNDKPFQFSINQFFPPALAVEGMESVPSVCVSVSALTAERFEVRTQNLVDACTLIISRMSLKVKVIGQRSRSPCWKTWIFDTSDGMAHVDSLSWHKMSFDVTPWYHDVSMGQEYWQGGHVAGGRVNAQAFFRNRPSFQNLFFNTVHYFVVFNTCMSILF